MDKDIVEEACRVVQEHLSREADEKFKELEERRKELKEIEEREGGMSIDSQTYRTSTELAEKVGE